MEEFIRLYYVGGGVSNLIVVSLIKGFFEGIGYCLAAGIIYLIYKRVTKGKD